MISKYHPRKKECEIEEPEELLRILRSGRYITLGMCRQNTPYVVTLSYGCDLENRALYFHSAFQGLKADILQENSNVCGTVIEDGGYQYGRCAHRYRSVVLTGTMSRVTALAEQKFGMEMLLAQLEPDPEAVRSRSLQSNEVYTRTAVFKLKINEITGKQGE